MAEEDYLVHRQISTAEKWADPEEIFLQEQFAKKYSMMVMYGAEVSVADWHSGMSADC